VETFRLDNFLSKAKLPLSGVGAVVSLHF
jgi:hypothetical protein